MLWEITGQIYDWDKKLWYDALVVWLEKYMIIPGLDFWLDMKDLQLYKAVDPKYIKDVFDIIKKIIKDIGMDLKFINK